MKDCPFCSEEILDSVISETENFRIIYNIAPILPGHCMLIPKKHYQSIYELSPEMYKEMMLFLYDFTKVLKNAFQSEDFNWSIQEGKSAGQTVFHFHIHIIIRKIGDLDEPGDWYKLIENNKDIDSSQRPRLDKNQIKQAVNYIQKYI